MEEGSEANKTHGPEEARHGLGGGRDNGIVIVKPIIINAAQALPPTKTGYQEEKGGRARESRSSPLEAGPPQTLLPPPLINTKGRHAERFE